ncbi:hypothetical protein IDJ77_11975 [Mucilaginibacter sp. ZT4R22]|uniref:SMC-Scp complex subunit ScpB n=1 Tax=Mucilaginibacter pankratovii TaxID=2772110 RepID=A0ABR7WQB9_9SPHI|nr:hypothetical protein [Mucilaginibacter pankratovii]MBD1364528.1 hypothetical protein [Mucilaginibacter pankratovii]
MYKQTEQLKKQLIEFTDVINAFNSETVQVIVIERVLDHLNTHVSDLKDGDIFMPTVVMSANPQDKEVSQTKEKKIGLTIILRLLLGSAFFDTPQSISAITDFCAEKYDVTVYTYQVSGLLLGLVKEKKLARIKNDENNRYVYLKPTG